MRKRDTAAPFPRRHSLVVDPDRMSAIRKLDCRHYDRCLDIAEDWSGFTCRRCKAFEPQRPIARDRDLRGCLALVAKILFDEEE